MPFCEVCGSKKEKSTDRCIECVKTSKRHSKVWVLAEHDFGGQMRIASIHKTLKGAKKKQHGFLNFMCTYIFEHEVLD